MTREITELKGGSLIVGKIPLGCKLCAKGSKMVLFVTGKCDSSCYYCPLSEEKAGKDVIFANETPVTEEEGIIEEADAIGAEGSGLSGGDPLCALDRTLHFIEELKKRFGKRFHLHLYTTKTDASLEDLQKLKTTGLDEIRFHPQIADWSGIEHAIALGMKVG
ncbi:MAG: radical SAM protein, partial [Candidatus Thorarchaeota archaeon]